MSTRSRIGILLPDDSILSVYHHWDGYPEWLGMTLEEHFNTYEKASELIDGGNMGCCYSSSEYDAETGDYIDVESSNLCAILIVGKQNWRASMIRSYCRKSSFCFSHFIY